MIKRETKNDDEDILTNLLQKNSFDPLTFMLDLQVTQAKVTDLATATVSDLQDLLHGLTKSPAEGMHFLTAVLHLRLFLENLFAS